MRIVALAALLLALAASAPSPRPQDLSSALAVHLGGPPPTTTACGRNVAQWRALVRAVTGGPTRADGYTNFTVGGAVNVRMAPWVCKALRRGPRDGEFGGALYVLAHETAHAAGTLDEAEASCIALRRGVPFLLRRFWTREPSVIRRAMEQAREAYELQPRSYRAVCG